MSKNLKIRREFVFDLDEDDENPSDEDQPSTSNRRNLEIPEIRIDDDSRTSHLQTDGDSSALNLRVEISSKSPESQINGNSRAPDIQVDNSVRMPESQVNSNPRAPQPQVNDGYEPPDAEDNNDPLELQAGSDYEPSEHASVSDQSYKPVSSSQKPQKRKKSKKTPKNNQSTSKRRSSTSLPQPSSSCVLKQSPAKFASLKSASRLFDKKPHLFPKINRYDLKDNAFIEKQPRLQFDTRSSIGQVLEKYSASITAGEIRLGLRRMEDDELLLSLAQDMDEVLDEKEQLLQTIDEMSKSYSTLKSRYAKLQQELKSLQNGGSISPETDEVPKIVRPRGRPAIKKKETSSTEKRRVGRPKKVQQVEQTKKVKKVAEDSDMEVDVVDDEDNQSNVLAVETEVTAHHNNGFPTRSDHTEESANNSTEVIDVSDSNPQEAGSTNLLES